ncbi:putative peptidase [Rickettsiales bacterium Ac37b]|nr:putative peptidase [Rickettsiales bacterium Ac37b]
MHNHNHIIPKKILLLHQKLIEANLDGFIIPSQDEFLGEYIPDYAKRLKWLTDFSGSNGVAIILRTKSAFFTDGRYTLQAKNELGSYYEIQNLLEYNIGKWILNNSTLGTKIGFDPWLHTYNQITNLQSIVKSQNIKLVPCTTNLIDELWHDRPHKPNSSILIHEIKYSGINSELKVDSITQELQKHQTEAVIITAPDSLCWLLNIRGTDVPYTPLVLARAILYSNNSIDLFINNRDSKTSFPPNIKLHNSENFEDKLSKLSEKTVQIDIKSASYWLINKLEHYKINILNKEDPCKLPKACKNDTEIKGAYESQFQDAVALCYFFSWLEQSLDLNLTELDISAKLLEFRKQQPDFIYPSFATIAAFAEHGAIIHYQPSIKSNRKITANGLLLIDSGGQYKCGTTDITRTIAIGTPSLMEQTHFTLVLKGHIALAKAIFPKKTCGYQLDILARSPLWQEGLDYAHGTGHGVGSFLGVHEGPQSISTKATNVALLPGMILSNEPGIYLENQYGIRIENLILTKNCESLPNFLCFETITFVPLDKKLIKLDLLTSSEVNWINRYHQQIWDKISPLISDQIVLKWLSFAVKPI